MLIQRDKESASTESEQSDDDNMEKSLKGSDNKSAQKGSVLSDDSSVDSVDSIESGCRICGFDDDHANLLLCEGCDKEVHTYCLNPPLEKVPTGDWFCDVCRSRMDKAEEVLGDPLKNCPPEMSERFGEICFAKSAQSAHWWPALIFDPRSFLHNREVVELCRKNLGKRYLVFFFENQDAFAAIPKKWIITWDEGVAKEYDKGKSVKHASKSRKEQFERAMEIANEAFEDISKCDSESGETEYDLPSDHSDIEEDSLPSRIPREIGGATTIFDLMPNFDWKPIREEVRKEVEAADPSEWPQMHEASKQVNGSVNHRASGKWQAQVSMSSKGKHLYIGMFPFQRKAAFAVQLFLEKMKAAMEAYQTEDSSLAPTQSESSAPVGGKKPSRGAVSDETLTELSSKIEIPFGSFTDNKPKRSKSKRERKEAIAEMERMKPKPPPPKKVEKKVDPPEDKKDIPAEITPPPLPPLSERERNELLSNTPLCYYYLLPLSEL